MGLFDGLLGGGGGGGGDYAGLLSGGGNIDYNKLLQQELANADNAKWAALSGALAEAGMPSRLPVPIGSAIGKAAAAFGGGENNSLLKILQIQKLATETQSLKELSELRKKLGNDSGLLDDIIKVGGAPSAGQPDTPSGGSASGMGTSPTSGGGGGGGSIPAPTGKGGVTLAEAKQAALRAGFDENGANTIAAITVPESSLNPNAYNPNDPHGGSFGLTQINGVHPGAREAMGNIDKAMELAYRVSNGGTNFSPWSTYQKGMHKPYLAEAASLPGRSAEAAPSGAAAAPLPAAFNLPKFSGLLGDRTDAEQPSIQATPDDGGLLNPGTPSVELRGDPSRVATSLGPPGSYRINSKGQPYSLELETMPPEAKARVAEAMRSIKERMLAGGGSGGGVPDIPPGDAGGGDGSGFLPGDLAAGLTPGQGPLAIPRPAGLPPMPAATAAPPGGLLAPPQAPAAPPAGPGLLATPQPPSAAPAAPPAVQPGPSYMPQMPPGMNEQQMLALQARIARLRAQAALGGITGDPFAGYAHLLENSPAYQRQKALIEQQMKYYGPEANPELAGAKAGAVAGAETPWKNYQEAYKADLARQQAEAQARLNDILKAAEQRRSASTEFETETVQTPDGRYETRRVPKYQLGRKFDPSIDAPAPLPGVPPTGASPSAPSSVPAEPQQQGSLVLPKPEDGYEWYATPQGPAQRPIRGGKVDEAQQKLKQFNAVSGNVVREEVDQAVNLIDKGSLGTTGTLNPLARLYSQSDAGQLQQHLKSILPNVGFDRLSAMRQTSPSGAAVGSLTEGEGKKLEAVAGSLDPTQRPEVLRRNLLRLHNMYIDAVHGSAEERARAVKDGRIGQALSDSVDKMYYPVTDIPRPAGTGGSAASGATSKPSGYNAIGPKGHRIYSVDGKTWYDATTNEPVK